MQFAIVTTILAVFASMVQGQSSSRTSTTPTQTFSTVTPLNPYAINLCVTLATRIPICGTTALLSIASSLGGCGALDFPCQCAYSAAVQPLASSPIIAACGLNTALIVQGAADQLCSCVRANNQPANITGSLPETTANAAPGPAFGVPGHYLSAFLTMGAAIALGVGMVTVL